MVRFAVTYTKDVRKKQRKQWLDGEIEVDVSTRSARLFPESSTEQGVSGAAPIARVDAVPEDVSLEYGGGDAFVMRGGGDRGTEYLVQVDEAACAEASGSPRGFVLPKQAVGLGFMKHVGTPAMLGGTEKVVQPKGLHQGPARVETQAAWRVPQQQEQRRQNGWTMRCTKRRRMRTVVAPNVLCSDRTASRISGIPGLWPGWTWVGSTAPL